MSKLVLLLRVKDGIFFVDEWLQCYEKLVDEIVVLDNGSTDGTYEKLIAHNKVVDSARTEGYNEGRDKNMMYELARKRNLIGAFGWILMKSWNLRLPEFILINL